MKITKLVLLLATCSSLFASCSKNKVKKEYTHLIEISSDCYEYSIGIEEIKPIEISSVIDNIMMTDSELFSSSFSSISLYGDDHKNRISYIEVLAYPYKKRENKLSDFREKLLYLKAVDEFETVHISYIDLIYDSFVLSLDCNITLNFNKDYQNYPVFLPSYIYSTREWYSDDEKLYPWNHKILSLEYGMIDLRTKYSSSDQVILKDISFSKNIKSYINDIKWSTFSVDSGDVTFIWKKVVPTLNFKILDSNVNLTDLASQDKIFCFTRDINSSAFAAKNYHIGGDIIYSLEVNGATYSIKDTYFIY